MYKLYYNYHDDNYIYQELIRLTFWFSFYFKLFKIKQNLVTGSDMDKPMALLSHIILGTACIFLRKVWTMYDSITFAGYIASTIFGKKCIVSWLRKGFNENYSTFYLFQTNLLSTFLFCRFCRKEHIFSEESRIYIFWVSV